MTLEATRQPLLSDFVKYESDKYEYAARSMEDLTVAPEDSTQPAQIGSVYNVDGTPLTKAEAAALTATTPLLLLIDDNVYMDKTAATRKLAVLKGSVGASSYCVVMRELLNGQGEAAYDTAELDNIAAALATVGIEVRNQY